jgi:nucleoid-associated protein YgaU
MATTRGGLQAARIYTVDKDSFESTGELSVACLFNPYEYTVSKTNAWNEKSQDEADTPQVDFAKAGAQTLKLSLTFDTYEAGSDVSQQTRELWKFMETKTQTKKKKAERILPPMVAFEWGVFKFVSYITSMSQRFTLFKKDGTPVRARVDVTFTQYKDVEDYGPQNPTSGGGPMERVWRVTAGDRLDTIAAEVYRDATQWRRIAEYNDLANPLVLRPGQRLRIPAR